ncbi:unnamed protein product [Clonostachys chloroleuca]|uniref:BHLH domain-containing protein n=1 Tax=Clonostachys chloroleuca TaxID=1926264 RepID=A0AA35MJ99_9HYPO|nr:unnamed protein product [Clonostachys chloroleuca]
MVQITLNSTPEQPYINQVMTDEDASNLFGLDDSSLGFIDDGSASGDVKTDPSNTSDGDAQFDSSGWDFPETNPFASFDGLTTSVVQPNYQTTSWDSSFFDATQQSPSAGFDTLSSPDNNPTILFGGPIVTPQDKIRPRNPVVQQQPQPQQQAARNGVTLTPALQEKLRNIAMPPHLQYHSPKSASSPESPTVDSKMSGSQSPDHNQMGKPNAKKRKVSEELEDDDDDEDGKPVKKTSHNMIEKRYRNNLNDKIAALRDAVPSLRIMSKSARGEDTTEDRQELHGLTPAHKLNKATVLSKATEYIRHLEKRYTRLQEENNTMKARIAAFEKLFMAGAMNGSITPMQQQPPTPVQYAAKDAQQQQQDFLHSPIAGSQDSSHSPPTGMIQVPEDMKRILAAQMAVGQPYPVPQQPYQQRGAQQTLVSQQQIQQQQQQMPQGRWGNAGPYFGKLMVGSLAGLMIMEAVRENEVSNERTEGRGLFALPVHLLGKLASSFDFNFMGYHAHSTLKVLLLLGTVLWVFIPSLFAPTQQKPKKAQISALHAAPPLASSIHVRRQAWLTAAQNVWIPRHNFFVEAAALMLKAAKLSLCNIVGAQGYQTITGTSDDQETARIQAWSIALDSQLAGGDVDINRNRLILTLLASGTLPNSPARSMLKALHIRLLLWDLSDHKLRLGITKPFASRLAAWKWNEARVANRRLIALGASANEAERERMLPAHLAMLVEQDCDVVLNSDVIQRAHNLAFNKDTQYGVENPIDGMDSVVDDSAVGIPMDAVAAWWSTQTLHQALTATLDKTPEAIVDIADKIESAILTAPEGSLAKTRAIVARAAFCDQNRGKNIAAALKTVGSQTLDTTTLNNSTSMIDSSSFATNPDLSLALRCATAIAHIRRVRNTAGADLQGLRIVDTIMVPQTTSEMSLLGYTAAIELMEQLFEYKEAAETFSSSLERLAGGLRLWIGGTAGENCGATPELRHKVVDRCLGVTKSLVGMEVDTGYGSMSEDEC